MRSSASSTSKITFLVPASKESGLGHYFRTLPYQRRIPESCYLSEGELITKLSVPGKRLPGFHDTEKFLEALFAEPIAFLYVDHFLLPEPVKVALQEQDRFPVSFFDGKFGNPPYQALVNTNPYASERSYQPLTPGKKYFLGAGFHLFREELEAAKKLRSVGSKKSRCFVCFGGTDAMNLTERAVRELPAGPEQSYTFVLGPGVGEKTRAAVEAALKERKLDATLHDDPPDFHALMASCDRAVLSCSTIVYEALHLGLAVACIQFADNQDLLGNFLRSNGVDVRDARRAGVEFGNLKYQALALDFGGRSQELIDYMRGFL